MILIPLATLSLLVTACGDKEDDPEPTGPITTSVVAPTGSNEANQPCPACQRQDGPPGTQDPGGQG